MTRQLLSKWTVWSTFIIAVLVLAGSLTGLLAAFPYAQETENWRLQAQGQDIGNLIGVLVLVTSVILARRGSLKSYLVWVGALFYFLYAYAIYTVAVHFNGLFLLYVAVLGLTLYTLLAALYNAMPDLNTSSGGKLAGYTLIAVGTVFAVLWLSEIIPAVLAGETPASTKEAGLWVNPVHVIDLAVVLPAFIITGRLALKHRRLGLFFAIPWLSFSVLMGSSIVAAMALMSVNGFEDTLPPTIMISLLVVASLTATVRFLRGVTPIDKP